MLATPVAFTAVMRAVITPWCTSQADLLSAAIGIDQGSVLNMYTT